MNENFYCNVEHSKHLCSWMCVNRYQSWTIASSSSYVCRWIECGHCSSIIVGSIVFGRPAGTIDESMQCQHTERVDSFSVSNVELHRLLALFATRMVNNVSSPMSMRTLCPVYCIVLNDGGRRSSFSFFNHIDLVLCPLFNVASRFLSVSHLFGWSVQEKREHAHHSVSFLSCPFPPVLYY